MSNTVKNISNWLFTPIYLLRSRHKESRYKGIEKPSNFFAKDTHAEHIGLGTIIVGLITGIFARRNYNAIGKVIANVLSVIGIALLASGAIFGFIKNRKHSNPSTSVGNSSSAGEIVEPERPQAAYQAKMSVDTATLDRWVTWRILVDTLQNHVDETRIQKANLWRAGKKEEARAFTPDIIFVLKDGRKVSYYDATFQSVNSKDVKEMVISDKGKGYDKERLEWVWSSKTDKDGKTYREMGIDPPGGKFGEGLKMVPASILKIQNEQEKEGVPESERVGLSFKSQNWEAALAEKKIETKSGESTFGVDYKFMENGSEVEGSQSIFHNPTEEMVNLVKNAGKLCLDFAPVREVLAASDSGLGFNSPGEKLIFVRGYRVTTCKELARSSEEGALFSYNLTDVDIYRDRDKLESHNAMKEVGKIIIAGSKKDLIKKLLTHASNTKNSYRAAQDDKSNTYGYNLELEFEAIEKILNFDTYFVHGLTDECTKRWCESFYEIFGKDAILCSSSDFSNDGSKQVRDAGKNLVVLNLPLFRLLKEFGISTDFDYSRTVVKDYQLGLSLDYRKDRWGPLRIVLDMLQNHADAAREAKDRGQTNAQAEVEFEVNNRWLPLSRINQFDNGQITAVRLKDNSKSGYSHGHLAQFGSNKSNTSSIQVGEFGEGLKIASAACLRLDLEVTCGSQDWLAEAYSYTNEIRDEVYKVENYSNLGYHVYKNPKQEGSETIIRLPDKQPTSSKESLNEILNILRNLSYYVLRHKECNLGNQNPIPLFTSSSGDITSKDKEDIYVKDFYITSEESDRLIFGYNFHGLKVNVDRDVPSQNDLIREVRKVLAELDNNELIKIIIEKAVNSPDGKYHEFQDLSYCWNSDLQKTCWKKTFTELFGNKAVIASDKEDAEREATWIGFKVMKLNKQIASTLHACGVLYDSDAIKAEHPDLNENELTNAEKMVLDFARWLDENEIIFPKSDVQTEYKVFEVAKNKVTGKDMPGILGYANIFSRERIGFKREVLHNPVLFFETYLEEKAHQLSGAPDGSRLHFNKALDSIIWTIFKDRASVVLERIKEVFPGFNKDNVAVISDNASQRVRLSYGEA